MKTTDEILDQLFHERNSSPRTQETYTRCTHYFEGVIGEPLPTILNIAETEEENNISWKNSSLRKWLIHYRKWCYETYKKSTAETYYIPILTIFRHFEITVNRLPYFSTKHTQRPTPINPDLMVDKEILQLAININNPLLKALVLFMSSSGVSRTDVLNLTIEDYLEATKEYHHTTNLPEAIRSMKDQEVTPTWNITRQKTGVKHFTFSSPESTRAINNYLLTRKDKDPRLFKINKRYLSHIFKTTNDELGLGKNGEFSRFSMHMLRRYHATQLIEAGLSESKVDLLQGRKPLSIAYKSYIKIKPSNLKEEYQTALPYLVVEDITRFKTENEILREENEMYKTRQDKLDSILERLEKLEQGD